MTPCIETSVGLDTYGYGQTRRDGKVVKAHRAAYAEANGLSMQDIAGVVIRHSCDNRRCVNPEHLLPGTHTDNNRDKVDRDRQAKWSKNGRAILSEEDVRDIRAVFTGAFGQLSALAREYGVGVPQMSRICKGKQWCGV